MKSIALLLAFTAALVPAQKALSQTLFQDTFDGLVSANISGSAPDIRPNTQTWFGSASFKQDGSHTSSGSVWLALSGGAALQVNTTYTFSLSLNLTEASSTNWVSFGFSNSGTTPSGGGMNNAGDSAASWMLARQNGGTQAYGGSGTANNYGVTTSTNLFSRGNITMGITLVTGATLADSTLGMSIVGSNDATYTLDLNGATAGSTRTVDASNYKFIGFGANTGNIADFTSFTATSSSIPEPATSAALAGAALLGLVGYRRRRS